MTELFWLITQEARVALMEYQDGHYRTKLDMAGDKAPWEVEPPRPEVPVHTDMDEEELGKFMSRPPGHQERVK